MFASTPKPIGFSCNESGLVHYLQFVQLRRAR